MPISCIDLLGTLSTSSHARQRQLPYRRLARRRHRAGSHGAGAGGAREGCGIKAGVEIPLHRSARGRRSLPRHRQLHAGSNHQAVQGDRRNPPRRLRSAAHPLSRQHRDHAAGRAALHVRTLCGRAAVPPDPECPEPDRRRSRAWHRPHRNPRIDGGAVRFDGQGCGDRNGSARDAPDHAQDLATPIRFRVSPGAPPQSARRPRPSHLRRQGERVQGLRFLPRHIR